MKKYEVVISENENASALKPLDIFILSDNIFEKSMHNLLKIEKFDIPLEARLSMILAEKNDRKKLYNILFRDYLFDYFYVDGSIKLTPADIDELRTSMGIVHKNNDGIEKFSPDTAVFDTYMHYLKKDFAYQLGSNIVFRNPKYYFIFKGTEFNLKGKTNSINDLIIEKIDIKLFIESVIEHYNSVLQHLKLFSSYFFSLFHNSLGKSKISFCDEIATLLSMENLAYFENILDTGEIFTGNAAFDIKYRQQWVESLSALEHFRGLVVSYRRDESIESFIHIIRFISMQATMIEHVKIEFGFDLDTVFNKYFLVTAGKGMKKVLLGLLDARINILAFLQNSTQLISSDQFLNPDYAGKLIFSPSDVVYIKKTCGEGFSNFKTLQKSLNDEQVSTQLLRELDEQVSFYMGGLLDDNNIGFIKLMGSLPPGVPELTEGPYKIAPDEISGGTQALLATFDLLDQFVSACEKKEVTRKAKAGSPSTNKQAAKIYEIIVKKAAQKLIRIYREENDPIVMIATAQMAINRIVHKGFDSAVDVLHVMSVNYGGSLIGSFAKHTFSRTIKRGRVLSNLGGVIYSIYDVKNANAFSKLVDYPFAEVVKDETIEKDVKARFERRNWLLAFDDNTNSGQTLDDIKDLARQSGFYGRIDLFPCRAGVKIENYKRSMSPEDILAMIGASPILARKSNLNYAGARYKEKLGTIVGNRLYKNLSR